VVMDFVDEKKRKREKQFVRIGPWSSDVEQVVGACL